MNSNKETGQSPEFLAKINKTVLRDVPGAEIITEEQAMQKDREKYAHELDEKGSAFPSILIEQSKQKTKQEKDRIELKQDVEKIDKQNKIWQDASKSKNKTKQMNSMGSQINYNTKKRDMLLQKPKIKTNTLRSVSKSKNILLDGVSVRSNQTQSKNHFNKSMLKNHSYKISPNIIKSQKNKHVKNQFNMTLNSQQFGTNNKKTQTTIQRTKQESLFRMDIDSFGLVDSNKFRNADKGNSSQLNELCLEKKRPKNTPQSKRRLNNQRTISGEIRNKTERNAIFDRLKEYQNTYTTIKHGDLFKITNKLRFE